MNEIRIDKSLCEKAIALDGWDIRMPETSAYAGYHFFTPSRLCNVHETYLELIERKNKGVFTLYKSDRLPTEHISQTKRKITFYELQVDLAEHSSQFSEN